MIKSIAILAVVIGLPLSIVLSTTKDAAAQRFPNSGYCPQGTCAKDGSSRARNVKHCSKANCRGGGGRR